MSGPQNVGGPSVDPGLGTDGTTAPPSGSGVRGYLAAILDQLIIGSGTPPAGSVAVTNFPVSQVVADAGLGTDGAGAAPTRGTGVRGWLASIAGILAGTPAVDPSDRVGRLLGVARAQLYDSGGTAHSGSNPVRVDPTGSTTQPVSISGTADVSDRAGRALGVISAASLPLPTGAAQDRTTFGAPMAVRISTGSGFVEEVAVGSHKYLGVGAVQDVHKSAGNSSTANLNMGITFPGAAEDTLSCAGIQVNFFADQPCLVEVLQGSDGTTWDTTDSWTRAANQGSARTFQAVNQYFKVRVTNVGAGATTTLRLTTFLCPMVEALPRALSDLGNLKVATRESPIGTHCTEDKLFSAYREASIGTAETDTFLLVNNTTDKDIVVQKILLDCVSTSRQAVARTYVSATTSATGTGITPVNRRRKGSPAASAMNAYHTPTVTARGTALGLMSTLGAQTANVVDGGLVIGPGKNLLITLLASNAGTTCAVSVVWAELPTNS